MNWLENLLWKPEIVRDVALKPNPYAGLPGEFDYFDEERPSTVYFNRHPVSVAVLGGLVTLSVVFLALSFLFVSSQIFVGFSVIASVLSGVQFVFGVLCLVVWYGVRVKFFRLIGYNVDAVWQFKGDPIYLRNCVVPYVKELIKFNQFVTNYWTVPLTENESVPVRIRQARPDGLIDSGSELLSDHFVHLNVQGALAVDHKEGTPEAGGYVQLARLADLPGSFSTVLLRYGDDVKKYDTTTQTGAQLATEWLVLRQIRDHLIAGAMNAAVQSLYVEGIGIERISKEFGLLRAPLIRYLTPLLYVHGIVLLDIQIERITGPYLEQQERRARSMQKSAADQDVARAEASAQVVAAQERLRSETARQTADQTILTREQAVQDERTKLADKQAETKYQDLIREMEIYRKSGNFKAEAARIFSENPTFKSWPGLIMAINAMNLPELAQGVADYLKSLNGGTPKP